MKTLKTLLVMMVLGCFSMVGFAQTNQVGSAILDANDKIVLDESESLFAVYEADISSAEFPDAAFAQSYFDKYLANDNDLVDFVVDFAEQKLTVDLTKLQSYDVSYGWDVPDFNTFLND